MISDYINGIIKILKDHIRDGALLQVTDMVPVIDMDWDNIWIYVSLIVFYIILNWNSEKVDAETQVDNGQRVFDSAEELVAAVLRQLTGGEVSKDGISDSADAGWR